MRSYCVKSMRMSPVNWSTRRAWCLTSIWLDFSRSWWLIVRHSSRIRISVSWRRRSLALNSPNTTFYFIDIATNSFLFILLTCNRSHLLSTKFGFSTLSQKQLMNKFIYFSIPVAHETRTKWWRTYLILIYVLLNTFM